MLHPRGEGVEGGGFQSAHSLRHKHLLSAFSSSGSVHSRSQLPQRGLNCSNKVPEFTICKGSIKLALKSLPR